MQAVQAGGCRVVAERLRATPCARAARVASSAAALRSSDVPSTSGRSHPAWSWPRRTVVCRAASTATESSSGVSADKLRVIIAGGGIGGLLLAAGLLKRGYDVVVLERDLTSIKASAHLLELWLIDACVLVL